MNRNSLASGSALAGVALLAACACGAGSGSVKALAAAGVHTRDVVIFGASCGTDHSAQPLFVAVGALLVLFGLSLRSLLAAALAAVGCVALAFGAFTAGPSTMNKSLLPHTDAHLLGYGAYVVAALFLIAAYMRAFATPKPLAAGTAMAGMAAATGCSCCMVTGALTGLIASAGAPWVYHQSYVLFAGATLMAIGLWRLGGIKPVLLAAAGAGLTYGGPKLLNWALPELMISGVNYRFVLSYATYLLGAATTVGSFVVAYRVAQRQYAVEPVAPALTEPVPATGG